MALQHLPPEQVETWSREQQDRWWLTNVPGGDMPQRTVRSAITGAFLGGIRSATNLYHGLFAGALFFGFMHRRYAPKPVRWGQRLRIDTHEPICAGLTAGAGLVGMSDVLVRVVLLQGG